MDSAVVNKSQKPSPKVPLSERINFRMIAVAAVVMFLIGYPVYMYVEAAMNGGVKKVGDVAEVDLKALGNFPFDEVNGTLKDVPPRYRELDGKKVILQGYPYVTNYAGDEIPEFQFVYNIAKCCFGGPPKVQERVFAHAPKGGTVPNYSGSFATMEGTLHVRPQVDGGKIVSLYDLDIDKIALVQQ